MDDTTRDESSPVEPDSDAAQEPEHTDGRRADAAPVREGTRDESSEVTAPALPSEPPAAPDRAQEAASQIPAAAGGQPGERWSRYRSHVRAVVPLLLAGLIGGGIVAGITVIVGAADGDSTTTVIREVSPSPAELTSLDPQPPSSETDAQPSADETRGLEPLSVQEIYELASPAVVQITTFIDRDGTGSFEPLIPRRGLGSGFVIDKEGHIVTNFHVIDGASSVRVVFSDGDGVLAKIVGSDPSTDIALLRADLDGRALSPLRLGDSDKVKAGELAIAIGNPFGLDRTVTAGIVSAVQRQIRAAGRFRIEGVIQTDAAINSGNSGGPLLNELGEVIGVNSQIVTDGGTGNVGIGFAVPVNTVKDVVTQLLETGEVVHAYLGVTVQSITEELHETVRLPVDEGVLVAHVEPGTSAADAGLRGGDRDITIDGNTFTIGGDIITEIDGEPVSEASDVVTAVSSRKPGDPLALGITRSDGTTDSVIVELGRRPSPSTG